MTRKLILSAGHCFADNRDNYVSKEKLEKFRIAFGVNDLTLLDVEYIPSTIRKIKDVKFHKEYQWPKAYSDIGKRNFWFKISPPDGAHQKPKSVWFFYPMDYVIKIVRIDHS